MEKTVTVQLKQRIVGIIVLIFLGLIILPILFGHDPNIEKKASDSKTTTTKINLSQENNFTAHLPPSESEQSKNNTAQTEALNDEEIIPQEIPKNTMSDEQKLSEPSFHKNENFAKIENNIINHQKTVSYPKTASNKITEESDVVKKPTSHSSSKPKPVAMSKPSVSHQKPIEAPLQLDKPKIEQPHPVHKEDGKKWTIQLGSFTNRANADSLAKKLKAKGFKAYVKTSKNSGAKEVSRVFVGPEAQHSKATANIAQIKKLLNVQGVIVKNNL